MGFRIYRLHGFVFCISRILCFSGERDEARYEIRGTDPYSKGTTCWHNVQRCGGHVVGGEASYNTSRGLVNTFHETV